MVSSLGVVLIYVGASLRGRPFSVRLGAPTEGRPYSFVSDKLTPSHRNHPDQPTYRCSNRHGYCEPDPAHSVPKSDKRKATERKPKSNRGN